MNLNRRNLAGGLSIAMVCVTMLGASFAAVPLYRMFCQVTGYGGTPSIGPALAPGATDQIVRIRFNADANPGLPWKFAPDQPEVTMKLGEEKVAFYHATNESHQTVTGQALYNVTPEKVGRYFHKTACFCFNQQTLEGGQTQEFPVSFWVDPAIRTDPSTADVKTITLSYTFYRSLSDAAKSGALAKAGPHVGPLKEPLTN